MGNALAVILKVIYNLIKQKKFITSPKIFASVDKNSNTHTTQKIKHIFLSVFSLSTQFGFLSTPLPIFLQTLYYENF